MYQYFVLLQEWFAGRLRQFQHCLSAKSKSSHKLLAALAEEVSNVQLYYIQLLKLLVYLSIV